MLFSSRATETAEVEGLWLANGPERLVPEYPDDSPKVQMCSPFIVPSLYSTSTGIHTGTPNTMKALNLFISFLI